MITVLVPAYNEEEIIGKFIDEFKKTITIDDYELLIVNDGSKDKTEKIIRQKMKSFKKIRLVNHEKNKGLGMALRTGFRNAKGDIIVTMDSDLTHPPKMIKKLAENISEDVDVCIASRYVKGGGMRDVPTWRVLLSIAANLGFSIIFGAWIRDITAGFKAYKAEKIKKVDITKPGFSVQLEIMAKLIKNKTKFKEIPFVLVNRKIGYSKFNFFKMVPKYFRDVLQIVVMRWFA